MSDSREYLEDFISKNMFVIDHANGEQDAVITTDDVREYFQAATSQQAERIAQQDEIIAELVEALDDIISLEHIPTNFGIARTIARSALAKVKGIKSE